MNEKKKPILGQEAVTDARTLGTPRMLILGLQHLFAMFLSNSAFNKFHIITPP